MPNNYQPPIQCTPMYIQRKKKDKKEVNSRSSLYLGTEFTIRARYFSHFKLTTFHLKFSEKTQRIINFKESPQAGSFLSQRKKKDYEMQLASCLWLLNCTLNFKMEDSVMWVLLCCCVAVLFITVSYKNLASTV
jgi:hypothetical protein